MKMLTLYRSFPSVIALLFTGCPTAIREFVITVVIFAFNLSTLTFMLFKMTQIRIVHIISKISKVLFPTLAHLNSPTTVILPTRILRVSGALNHSSPDVIKSLYTFCGKAMTSIVTHLPCFMFKTTTTLNRPSLNMTLLNFLQSPARAAKEPIITTFVTLSRFKGNQSPKPFSSNILKSPHILTMIPRLSLVGKS